MWKLQPLTESDNLLLQVGCSALVEALQPPGHCAWLGQGKCPQALLTHRKCKVLHSPWKESMGTGCDHDLGDVQ